MRTNRVIANRIAASAEKNPLTVIAAPVASGKTSLLKEVAAKVAESRKVHLYDGGISATVSRISQTRHDPSDLIVIDDADLLPRTVLEQLVFTADRSDHSSTAPLLLTFSNHTELPLSGLHMRGRMEEYGLRDINFTHAEAAEMLNLGVADMMSPAFRVLMRRSEGWIGAWRLIHNVLEGGHGLEAATRWLHGDTRELEGYFSEQIMRRLPADLQRFITLIAPIWPLDIDLVAHLYGDSGPGLLHAALQSCPFLGMQEPGGPPPKPNPLFVEFLIANGRRRFPTDQRSFFRMAAEWFLKQTDWPRAAQNFVHAGMPDQAAELLSIKSDEIFARFGDVLLVQDDGSSIYGSLSNVPQTGPARDLIRGTILRGPNHSKPRRTKKGELGFEEFLADFGRDDLQAVRESADRWLESESGTALQRATIANALAVSHLADLRLVDMQQALERANTASLAARSPFLAAWGTMNWVFLHLERGNFLPARQTLLSALQEPSVRGLVRHTVTVMLAACERIAGNIDVATDLISGSIDLSSRHATSDTMVLGWTTAAQCVQHMAGADEAASLLARAAKIAGRRAGERGQLSLRLMAMQLSLQSGSTSRLSEMREEIEQIRALTSKVHFGRRFDEDLRFVSARLLLASGAIREAGAIAQPIVQRAHTSKRAKRWTEAMLIRVGTAIAEENFDAACRLFWHCEAGIAGHPLHQLLIDERDLLAPIVPTLREQILRPGFNSIHRDLVEALSTGRSTASLDANLSSSSPTMSTQSALTRKESDIMRLVAAGFSNQEVGGRLGVSEVTVKWHLRNIFQKLEVKSRTAAIAKLAMVQ